MTREFVELPGFMAAWKRLGLTDEQLRELEYELALHPQAGDMMASTGGVRKLRFAFPGRGKSGSARVIYVDFAVYEKLYLLTVYQKKEQSNLTVAECAELKKLVALLEKELRKRSGKPYHMGNQKGRQK